MLAVSRTQNLSNPLQLQCSMGEPLPTRRPLRNPDMLDKPHPSVLAAAN